MNKPGSPKQRTGPRPFQWIWPVALFSLLINALYLVGPIFMMQVYDRVLPSANVPTLVGLFGIVVLLLLFFGCLDYIRGQVVYANSERMSKRLAETGFSASVLGACELKPCKEKSTALDDVSTLRSFLVSPTFTALFDLPWSPIFLLFVFALHPILGVVATVAAIVLAILALINERVTREGVKTSSGFAGAAQREAQSARRNAETLRGNGMVKSMGVKWGDYDDKARETGIAAHAVNSGFSVSTKTLRLVVQSGILGTGAYFAIKGELQPGAMIAASIVFGRALAPLESILGNYSSVARARDAWKRIRVWCDEEDADSDKQPLPPPNKSLAVSALTVTAPGSDALIVRQMSFALQAGDVLGVMGPSGSGKSTLGKALIGAWQARAGIVRLDGAELTQWPADLLGEHIGYLPQDIELFSGSVASNIARMDPDPAFDDVLAASQLAGTHELVLQLPDGYNTILGEGGVMLSAGQRQRLALARAVYRLPFLVVLDEPNSNLDAEGDRALGRVLTRLKEKGCITIVIAHRQNVLEFVNKLMLVRHGVAVEFGERDKVLAALQEQVATAMPHMVKR